MGRKFIGTCCGRGQLFGCRVCHTYVTCSEEITSTAFTGGTGPAILFRKVWNISHGYIERRKMTTGWHVVRDVFCLNCKNKLGWMYELAMKDDQAYKETQVILENANIAKIGEELKDPLGELAAAEPSPPNLEVARYPSTSSDVSRWGSRASSDYGSTTSDSD